MYFDKGLNKILLINKKAKKINEGSSRKVYDLNDNHILKVAKNKRGKIECSNEYFIYNDIITKYKKDLCPVIQYEKKYIVMKKVKTMDSLIKSGSIDVEYFENVILKQKEEFILYLKNKYDIDEFDITFAFNWGIDEKDNIVLLDYGHNYFGEEIDS